MNVLIFNTSLLKTVVENIFVGIWEWLINEWLGWKLSYAYIQDADKYISLS